MKVSGVKFLEAKRPLWPCAGCKESDIAFMCTIEELSGGLTTGRAGFGVSAARKRAGCTDLAYTGAVKYTRLSGQFFGTFVADGMTSGHGALLQPCLIWSGYIDVVEDNSRSSARVPTHVSLPRELIFPSSDFCPFSVRFHPFPIQL
jgi:hypothetical protein